MTFVLRMTARELRASWRRLLFFFICVAIGVGAIIALRSIVQSVRGTIVSQARTLLGADVVISANRPWSADLRREIDGRLSEYPIAGRSEIVETSTMARAGAAEGGAARMVEVLAVDAAYPLYGAVVLGEPPAAARGYRESLVAGRGRIAGLSSACRRSP